MIEVPTVAITALVQYYDQQMRCFTFRDFQLVLMLEEFEKIVGCLLGGTKPFFPLGHSSSIPRLSKVLGIPMIELREKEMNRNGVKSFPKKFMEDKAGECASKGWRGRRKALESFVVCLHYVWMVSHFVMHNGRPTCPLEDFCMAPDKSKINWEELLASLTGSTICWFPRWEEVPNVLCRCGVFPNLPLMGTKGYVNYC
ncbi:hypothetical protein GmHk_U059780 [Glycine max]|nr:hypothetical protein GmHk_U059780 [Glycine max]